MAANLCDIASYLDPPVIIYTGTPFSTAGEATETPSSPEYTPTKIAEDVAPAPSFAFLPTVITSPAPATPCPFQAAVQPQPAAPIEVPYTASPRTTRNRSRRNRRVAKLRSRIEELTKEAATTAEVLAEERKKTQDTSNQLWDTYHKLVWSENRYHLLDGNVLIAKNEAKRQAKKIAKLKAQLAAAKIASKCQ